MEKMQLREALARNLLEIMSRTPGLETQQALAKKAKMGQSHISRILNKSTAPTTDTIAALATALRVQPWELLSDAESTRQAVLARYMGAEDTGKVVAMRKRRKD
jgi:DNA-binding phage protein